VDYVGIWQIDSIASNTVRLVNYTNGAYSGGDMTCEIWRPVTHQTGPGWGTGNAVLDGSQTNWWGIRCSGNALAFLNLNFQNSFFPPSNGCTVTITSAIWDNSGSAKACFVRGIYTTNYWAGVRPSMDWVVVQNSTFTYFGEQGVIAGFYSLVDGNTFTNGMSCTRCLGYSVIRFNTIIAGSLAAAAYCGNHSDGIGPNSSPSTGVSRNGWIYGNWIENAVEGCFFTETGHGGIYNWMVCFNVLVGHADSSGSGDAALFSEGAPGVRYYNNTVFGYNGARGWLKQIDLGERDQPTAQSTNAFHLNNIFYSIGTITGAKYNAVCTNTLTSDANWWYEPTTPNAALWVPYDEVNQTNYPSLTFSQWQTFGFDLHSTNGVDPLFVNVSGSGPSQLNLNLQSSSTAKLATAYSIPVVISDISHTRHTANAPLNVGAYQYVTPPTIYTSTITGPFTLTGSGTIKQQ
jgi:hypothetical protein